MSDFALSLLCDSGFAENVSVSENGGDAWTLMVASHHLRNIPTVGFLKYEKFLNSNTDLAPGFWIMDQRPV